MASVKNNRTRMKSVKSRFLKILSDSVLKIAISVQKYTFVKVPIGKTNQQLFSINFL